MRSPLRLVARTLGALVLPATVAVLYAQASACGAPCSASERYFDQGTRTNVGGLLTWESSPIDGPFLPFEGSTTYRMQHKLGARPYVWHVYLSFSERPEGLGNGGSAQAAGNLALVLFTTEDEIVVKNDTCGSYFIRVVATARAAGGADAGPDATSDARPDSAPEASTDATTDTSSDAADASIDVTAD